MSSSLALAGVTAMLMDRLNDGLLNNNFNGPVDVSAKPPDKVIQGNGNENAQLNIFLYQVTPNIGWRNNDLPSRNIRGQRITNPPLAMDLHYLISAYGEEDAETDLLIGSAVHLLHEMPVFSREEIRNSLSETGLPSHLQGIGMDDSGLADQMELIKITPEYLNTEEMSKLWSAIQTNYRPSVAYIVTVVLIQAEEPTRSPLPVLTRGRDDSGPTVQPYLTPAIPMITSIEYSNQQHSTQLNSTITIHGHHLDGNNVQVVFTHGQVPDLTQIIAIPVLDVSATELTVQIPNDAVNWAAGIYTVEVTMVLPGEIDPRLSNKLPFVLAPLISLPPVDVTRSSGHVTVEVNCSPQARPNQLVKLIIGQEEAIAEDHPDPTDPLTFIFGDIPQGTYLVRMRIDGAESQLIDMTVTPPAFDTNQSISVPL